VTVAPGGHGAGAQTEAAELARLLGAAEPAAPRPFAGLVRRLDAAGLVLEVVGGPLPATASGVVYDSRQVRPGNVFVAVAGVHTDGRAFVAPAAEAGARAAIVEQPADGVPVAQVVVSDSRRALAVAAAWWYGDPSLELGIVGITGTDGKTTTSFLATAVLEAAGSRPGC
jgi:UDP-N-acetylmuramyl pentapeptide synthase